MKQYAYGSCRSAKAFFLQARALHLLDHIQSAIAMAKLAHELAPSDATITQFLTQRQLDTTGEYLTVYS